MCDRGEATRLWRIKKGKKRIEEYRQTEPHLRTIRPICIRLGEHGQPKRNPGILPSFCHRSAGVEAGQKDE